MRSLPLIPKLLRTAGPSLTHLDWTKTRNTTITLDPAYWLQVVRPTCLTTSKGASHVQEKQQ